jgi:hypothetical protein
MGKAEGADRLKYEEVGYVRACPPHTASCCLMRADKPCRATRVRRFMQEFLRCNENWLVLLTARVRAALRGLPADFLGENGADFVKGCFSDTAFAYANIQVRSPGRRRDPKHFDGGASLLHMGLTLFGHRDLECWFAGGERRLFPQSPGSVYVGNMCAVEHRDGRAGARGFFEPHGREGAPGLLITVMLRSDLFRHSHAPKQKGKPTTTDLFDIVNSVVARHLAAAPLELPDFACCARPLAEEHSAGAASAPRQSRPRAESSGAVQAAPKKLRGAACRKRG